MPSNTAHSAVCVIEVGPSCFCAQAALDAARNLHTGTAEQMEHEALGNRQAELFQTRVTLNQLRAELEHIRDDNQATADDLDKTITWADHELAHLDSAIARIHHRPGYQGPLTRRVESDHSARRQSQQ